MLKHSNINHETAQSRSEQTTVAVNSGGAASRQTWRNIRLIVGREYSTRLRGRGFRIVTIILVIAVVIGAFLPTIFQYISPQSTSQTSVAIVNKAGLADASVLATAATTLNGTSDPGPFAISVLPAGDQTALLDQVKNGRLGILLLLERGSDGRLKITDYASYSSTNDPNQGPIYNLAAILTFQGSAQKLGLTSAQTANLMAPPDLTSINTLQNPETGSAGAETPIMDVFAIIGAYLMMYSVLGYAGGVAQGVALEKSNRVMEILVTATTPFQLLAGKIVGIALTSLTQMACMVVFGIGAILLQTPIQASLFGTSAGGFSQALTAVSIPAYAIFLTFFLLNFFLYAALYAGLGAMARKPEEVSGATVIATIMLILCFFGIITVIQLPNAVWVQVVSYIPFFTGSMMFARLVLGQAGWWEAVASIILMLAAIYACTLGAVRIYRHAVLNYGQRPGLGALLKLARKA